MPSPKASFLCLAFAVVCVSTCAAQRRAPRRSLPPRPAPNAPRPNILAQQIGEESPPTTLVTLDPFPLSAGALTRARASFGGSFSFTGRPAGTLNFFSLDFFQHSAACAFGSADALTLVIDDQPLKLSRPDGPSPRDGLAWLSADTEGQGCSESAGITLSPRTLARLAAAQKLSARVGDASLVFTPEALGALRQLIGRVPLSRKPFD